MSSELTECVRILVPTHLSERVQAAAEALHAAGHSSWTPIGSDREQHDLYFDHPDDADRACNAINLQRLDSECPDLWTIDRLHLPETDWAEAWKVHFKVEHVSTRIVIRPIWEAYIPKSHEIVIDIDPGMSFGTGRHETTRSCLRLMDRLVEEGFCGSFLDVGTGSGILSIAAVRLGFSPVHAFDIDADAVANARENLERNGVEEQILMAVRDLADLPPLPSAKLVVANVLAPVLIEYAEKIVGLVTPKDGCILLSGILSTQAEEVADRYAPMGWDVHHYECDGEWTRLELRAR